MKKTTLRLSTMLSVTMVSAAIASLVLFTGFASAHVTVNPGTTTPGAWETYTIKVPVEKDIPTVKVSLKIPDDLEFKQYRALPDWKVELTKDNSDKVTVVTWTSEGDGIQPGEFQQFDFVAKNPGSDAELAWDAFQYYSDGSIVEWTGGEGAEKPHSITLVTSQQDAGATAANAGHSHSHDDHAGQGNTDHAENHSAENAQANSTEAADAAIASSETAENSAAASAVESDATATSSSQANTWTVILSSAALLASLIALVISIRSTKKST
ncbi:hypothetical protein D3C77_339500 [compost metagenome]